ncbi:hypothetical protein UCDDA912_g02915 [Diaporthe ampelina]|uniref:F-box domain-containing protein n=1 Tax=Diaporthe ampelina TaxID=1214573 RepID=A0A0G2FSZ7_9PEZI|nr:hypothetical protein UCDDA912_g02915 [Diaporthe ampelina]
MEDTTAQHEGPVTSGPAQPLAQPGQPGVEASQTTNTAVDAAEFNLSGLPTEMVIPVFESLVPDPLPIGTALPLSTDIMASRETLLNLCLTSKRFQKIAQPLVYRNVIITSHTQMATLLVILLAYKVRRGWIRSLAVIADLQYDEQSRRKDRATLAQAMTWLNNCDTQDLGTAELRTFREVEAYLPRIYHDIQAIPLTDESYAVPRVLTSFGWTAANWESYEQGLFRLYQKLLQRVMRLQTNLEDILATVPSPKFDSHLSPAIFEDWTFGRCNVSSHVQARADSENPFKTLRRVKKQADPKKRFNFVPDLKLEHLKSQKWEFFRDDGDWFLLCDPNNHRWPVGVEIPSCLLGFSHITELNLQDTKTHPAILRLMLSYSQNLKTLCYTSKATEWNANFTTPALTPAMAAVTTLQHAIDQVRGGLTELRLGWVPWGADLTEEEQAAVAPHRVDVSGFPQLTSIDIDLPFVLEEENDGEEEHVDMDESEDKETE